MADTPIRVGFVGLSGRGGGLARQTDELGYNVVAGADVDAEARASFEDAYDATTYESYETLFETADLDAAVIATPNAFHSPAAVAALDADVNVLVEKPLADSLEAAHAVARAEERSDAFGMVGFQRRFYNQVTAVKSHIEAGRFGELVRIEVNYARRRGIPDGAKVHEELGGGGVLLDLGAHVLDFAFYFLDFPEIVETVGTTRSDFMNADEAVSRWRGPPAETTEVEDAVWGTLRTDDGALIDVHAAWAQHQPDSYDIKIWGTDAGASFNFHNNEVVIYEDDTTAAELECFFEAVRTGQPPDTNTIEQGVAVQRAIDGIYRSAEREQKITLE